MMAIQAHIHDFAVFGTDCPTPNGTAIRDYVHVSDLADAHIAALRLLPTGKATGAFNLGTGSGYSVKQVLDAIAAETGESPACSTALRRAVADASLSHSEFDFTPRHSALKNVVQTAWSWHRCAHPKLAEKLAGPISDLPPIGTCGPALQS